MPHLLLPTDLCPLRLVIFNCFFRHSAVFYAGFFLKISANFLNAVFFQLNFTYFITLKFPAALCRTEFERLITDLMFTDDLCESTFTKFGLR